MQSPKFPLKKKDIEDVINVARLRSRWREKVRDAMRKQPIPDPVEHLDFHVSLDAMCSSIAAEVQTGAYIPRPPIRLLSEKNRGLCRQLVIPSVKDALVLQTLSDALWSDLQKRAPSKNAFYAPNDHRFSQVRGQTEEYGPINAWIAFQEKIFGFTKSQKFIVVTDIANYYDCISYDHLRNILADLSIAREHSLDLLLYTLSHMLWQPDYMPRVHVGLPQINLDAPRLLAHCFLFEIDRLLMERKGVDFARYMDDLDIGVESIAEGKRVLRDLDLALQTRQVRLNSGKTKILSEREASLHFCIRQNAFLHRLEDSLLMKRRSGAPIDREKEFISRSISRYLNNGAFRAGNGEKILKRLINYARQFEADIDDRSFSALLIDWPGCRKILLRWWQHSPAPCEKLELLRDFLASSEVADDDALITIAAALVAAPLPSVVKVSMLLNDICKHLDQRTSWGFYAKAWILSKYGTDVDLMRLVESSTSVWVTEEYLSRLVAGLFPRMMKSSDYQRFLATIRRYNNRWSQSVLDFYESISTTAAGFRSVEKFVRAPNPSERNRISHAKFLMLMSLIHNSAVPKSAVENVKRKHGRAFHDDYYRLLISEHAA